MTQDQAKQLAQKAAEHLKQMERVEQYHNAMLGQDSHAVARRIALSEMVELGRAEVKRLLSVLSDSAGQAARNEAYVMLPIRTAELALLLAERSMKL